MRAHLIFALLVFFLAACGGSDGPETEPLEGPLFQLLSQEKTNITFKNSLKEDDRNNGLAYEYFYNGGGVSVGDLNGDDLPDLFFTGNQVGDRLYFNRGDMVFEDVTEKALKGLTNGWSTGSVFADVNGDGLLDIYVCRGGDPAVYKDASNRLFINKGDGTFVEKAAEMGLDDSFNSTQAAFFDYDRDGDLDVYVLNHPRELFAFTRAELMELFQSGKNESDRLYRNDSGKFVNVSVEMGINNHAFGLGLAVGDIDNNGWPDVYVANDYEDRDYLFMNKGGTFSEELNIRTKHVSNFGMGVDIADFNNDGDMDILELDMAYPSHERSKRNMASMSTEKFWRIVQTGNHFQYMVNTLQMNNGNGTFSEIGQFAGVAKTDWSWAGLFADLDNDGKKDIVITNGQHRDLKDRDFQQELEDRIKEKEKLTIDEVFSFTPATKQRNFVFRNDGDLHFSDQSEEWGLDRKVNSNGLAYADLDNDGDLDLIVNNLDDVASVYENRLKGQKHYIRFALKGPKKNTFAYGARIRIYHEGGFQVQDLQPTRGFQSSVEPVLHFGLGSLTAVDRVEITWPDGKQTVLEGVEIDQQHVLDYATASFTTIAVDQPAVYFTDITTSLPIEFRHTENSFNDFDREVLLPHAFSNMGPCVAVADVNGDGTDDVFIGGAKNQAGALYLQNLQTGKFKLQENSPFARETAFEDVGAHFFDADGDGDPDLYVTSGGNDFDANSSDLQDRLYINDGKGNFIRSGGLPEMITSTKVVRSGDIDGDGDLDLFVGGRIVPGKYPESPRSYLLLNEGGTFRDVTATWNKSLEYPGLVSGAELVDINGDKKADLTLVCEWGGLQRYINKGGKFEAKKVDAATEGLWFSLTAADIDNDGDMDFVAGNLGKNCKFKASDDRPFNIYGADFDDNGTYDAVLSTFHETQNLPVRGRECSSQQMPFITEKCPSYKSYAESDMEDLFGGKLGTALHKTARTLYSAVFINDGSGNFKMQHLPTLAQLSPILGVLIEDINQDGNPDLITVGNMYEAEVETVRYDAGRGVCLLGDGKGGFSALEPKASGFFAWNNVKGISRLKIGGRPAYLLPVNNSYPQVFIRN